MSDTDRLRDLLKQAAPAQPDLDPTTRATAVARRGRTARTRDRALVAAAAVAAVAIAVAAPISLSGGDGPDQATPAPPADLQVEPCPVAPVDTGSLGSVSGLGEVVAVRGCRVQSSSDWLSDEPLTGEHARAFAEDVAAVPPYEMPSFCMAANVMPQPWALQVQTAGGELITLGSTMRICSSVSVDGTDRGVDAVVAAFLGNQVRQDSGIPELDCPSPDQVGRHGRLAEGAPTWNASFDPTKAIAGVVCYRADPLGEREYGDIWGVSAPLSDVSGELEPVRDDLAANLRPSGNLGGCTDTGPQRMIVLEDADGDQAAWVDDQCIGTFIGPGGVWEPGPAAEQAIDDALSGR
jgi:hypothetical protein